MDDFRALKTSWMTHFRSFRMKHTKGLGMVVLTLSVIIAPLGVQEAHSTSTFNLACPEKFIATVTNVEDIESSSTFPKVEVDFQIIQTLKGEKILSKKIQVVKDGPVKFKSGEIYTVESNNIWLCSATLFSKL
jgi:hypothetical protein